MICKDCVHYEVCGISDNEPFISCNHFKPQSRFVEVVRCKDCKNWDKDTKIKAPYCTEEGKPIDMTMVDYAECEKWSCWSTAKYTRYNDFCSCGEKALKAREKK